MAGPARNMRDMLFDLQLRVERCSRACCSLAARVVGLAAGVSDWFVRDPVVALSVVKGGLPKDQTTRIPLGSALEVRSFFERARWRLSAS
jgi:hypothetical protein